MPRRELSRENWQIFSSWLQYSFRHFLLEHSMNSWKISLMCAYPVRALPHSPVHDSGWENLQVPYFHKFLRECCNETHQSGVILTRGITDGRQLLRAGKANFFFLPGPGIFSSHVAAQCNDTTTNLQLFVLRCDVDSRKFYSLKIVAHANGFKEYKITPILSVQTQHSMMTLS